MVAGLQKAGRVRAVVDTRAVGEMLFNNTNQMFTVFVQSEGMTVAALKRAIRRQNRPLLEAAAAE